MEFSFLFHLHEGSDRRGRRREGGTTGREEERREKKEKREALEGDGEVEELFQFLSDGILCSPRGWRDETGRKTTGRERKREEGEVEDVVAGRSENAKRTHPTGRQD